MRYQMASILFVGILLGCSGSSDTPNVQPPPTTGVTPSGSDTAAPPAAQVAVEYPSIEEFAAKEITIEQLPPLVLADAPQPPKPFSGEEAPADAVIPEETQRLLPEYSIQKLDKDFEKLQDLVLADPNAKVRARAAECIRYVSMNLADEAMLTLRAATTDPQEEVRLAAAKVIYFGMDNDAWDIHSALGEVTNVVVDLRVKERYEILHAYSVLKKLGPDALPALPYLLNLVSDREYPYRKAALEAIGAMGPAAKENAAPRLVRLLITKDEKGEEDIRLSITTELAETLGQLGCQDEAIALIRSDNKDWQYYGVVAMDQLPEHSPEAVDALMAAAKEKNLQYHAATALGKVRPSTPEIFEALKQIVQAEGFANAPAYEAMGNLDPPVLEARDYLLAAAETSDDFLEKQAIQNALTKIKVPPSMFMKPVLKEAEENGGIFPDTISQKAAEYYPAMKELALDPQQTPRIRSLALLGILKVRYDLREVATDDELIALGQSCFAQDQPAELRGAAAAYLFMFHEVTDETKAQMLATLDIDAVEQVHVKCIASLCQLGYEPAIPKLVEIVKRGDNFRKEAAVFEHVGKFGTKGREFAPIVIAQLEADGIHSLNYKSMMEVLLELDVEPKKLEPLYYKLLGQTKINDFKHDDVMFPLVQLIADNDELDPKKVNDEIIYRLEHPVDLDPWDLFSMIGTLGPKAAPTTKAIIPYVKEGSSSFYTQSIDALIAIGPDAKEAVPALIEAAQKFDGTKAQEGLQAIGSGGKEFAAAAPTLLADLQKRNATLETLAALAPDSAAAIPDVTKILESENNSERERAVNALGAWGPASKEAVPKLIALLKEENFYYDDAVKEALQKIDPDNPDVVAALKEADGN